MTHDVRDEVVDYGGKWSSRTELSARQYGKVNERNALVPRDHWLQAWERAEIIAFHHEHPPEGYDD